MNLSDKSKTILAGAFISLSTLIAYWNVQHNTLIGYDDVKYLIDNEYVRSGLSFNSIKWALTATYDANWFPLTWLSHMLDMTLFGSNPLGHHLENLFLHITNALLLMCILTRLTGRIWRSAAVALLFALHPLHVESVAWIAERKDVLSTLFFLLTIRSYIKYTTDRSGYRYWTAIFLYLCGLAAKPMLVSLPLVLLLLDFWPLRRISPNIPDSNKEIFSIAMLLREKAPFALLSIASCIVTLIVQRNGGAMYEAADQPLIENSLHALFNYTTYLRKIFWPSDLGVIYPYVNELTFWLIAGSAIMITGLTILAGAVRQRMPYVTIGWFWFLVTMAPVAGFVRIGVHSIADRYTYIPSIGIFILVVWLLSDILSGKRYEKVIISLISAAVMIPLAAVTWKQTTYWKDSITLFEHNLDVTSNNWVAQGNLGAELLKYNRPQQALLHLQDAARINPESYTALFNLGVALNRFGDRTGAINAFSNAIKVSPTSATAYFEAGRICYETGDKVSAYEIHSALTQVDPDMADALGKFFILLDNTVSADRH